jgi:hypothetical protein
MCLKFGVPVNGNVHRYVYYGCTKARGTDCKCGYTEEKELIKQFESLLEKIDINEIQIKEKIKAKVEDIKKFNYMVLGSKEKIVVADVDIRNYAKYILRDGSTLEKRELLGCFKSQILLNNKEILLKTNH